MLLVLAVLAALVAVATAVAGAGSIDGDWYSTEGGVTYRLSVDGDDWAYYAADGSGEAELGSGEVRREGDGEWVFSGGIDDSCEPRDGRLVFRDGSTMSRG
ncbi:MAG: hypothetical protein KHZ24_04370 [Coriobacteriia bacterium]|nr:hypothetical protein [Coriobacteriia bacterium]